MRLTSEQCFWLELVSKKGLGSKILKELFSHFGSAEKISHAEREELEAIGASERLIKILLQTPALELSRLENVLEKEHIECVTFSEETYPVLLKEIPDPPVVLFFRGKQDIFTREKKFLAIVGSRRCSSYAKRVLESVFQDLPPEEVCIVSGFAYGVDTLAHTLSLQYGFQTIAVLGSGVEDRSIYPAQNRSLLLKFFLGDGVIMSEFFPWQKALPQFFPQRNRIIAGLSETTFVVEAGKKSGALLTANLARDYHRNVAAAPGSLFSPTSMGTNRLLSEGAFVICEGNDLCELLEIKKKNASHSVVREMNREEEKIFSFLKTGEKHFDEIIEATQLSLGETQSALSLLFLDGIVKKIGSDLYGI